MPLTTRTFIETASDSSAVRQLRHQRLLRLNTRIIPALRAVGFFLLSIGMLLNHLILEASGLADSFYWPQFYLFTAGTAVLFPGFVGAASSRLPAGRETGSVHLLSRSGHRAVDRGHLSLRR